MKQTFAKTAEALAALPRQLPVAPKAILVVSGHWEASAFRVATSPRPPMEYDYVGFPAHTYHIRYPAPGAPALAARVRGLLQQAGLPSEEDPKRGFDHGVFVPLVLMYPDADVPVLMLSMRADYDPLQHLRAGAALAPLRDERVLIVGSGLTYHDLRRFGPPGAAASEQFEGWLAQAVGQADPAERNRLLAGWEAAPSARLAHPREDHLLPLMVAAGAAGDSVGERLFVDHAYGITMGSYWFVDRR
jgi:aromatic ring-opening dioxygenase catalytic subunit (LigB family)